MKVSDQISDFWKFLIDGKVPKHKTKKKKEKKYCEVCGAELIIKQSKTDKHDYWVCPNWKVNDQNHTVILVKEGEKGGICKGDGKSQSNSRSAVR